MLGRRSACSLGTAATKPGAAIVRRPYRSVRTRASATIRRCVAAAIHGCADRRSSIYCRSSSRRSCSERCRDPPFRQTSRAASRRLEATNAATAAANKASPRRRPSTRRILVLCCRRGQRLTARPRSLACPTRHKRPVPLVNGLASGDVRRRPEARRPRSTSCWRPTALLVVETGTLDGGGRSGSWAGRAVVALQPDSRSRSPRPRSARGLPLGQCGRPAATRSGWRSRTPEGSWPPEGGAVLACAGPWRVT
jgi:hypothetical protein